MDDNKGLDEILAAPAEEPEPITEPKSEIHEASPIVDATGRLHHSDGKFAPKDKGGEPEAPEPQAKPADGASPAPEPANVPESALLGERRRRQERDQENATLRQQILELQARGKQPEQPVDFWDNPHAVIGQVVSQEVATALQQWEARQAQQRADASEAAARAKYPDYDDAFEKFREQLGFNPALIGELHRSPDPAEFAYQRGKAAIEMANPDAYRAKIEAELRQKIEAELLAAAPRPQSLPPTTAGQRSVGDRSGPQWTGPQSLSNILRGST